MTPTLEKILEIGSRRDTGLMEVPYQLGEIWNILPFVERGWTFRTDTWGRIAWLVDKNKTQAESTAIYIKKGQNRKIFDLEYEPREYPQWLNGLFMWASNPNVVQLLRLGEHQYSVSPLSLQCFGTNGMRNNQFSFSSVYKHTTAYGPLYGLALDPPKPIPIPRSDFKIEYYLCPDTSITDTAEIVALVISRIIITDEDEFYNALQKASAQFLVGKKLKKWIPVRTH